jgi:CheY-like chemotaxis protein
MNTTHSLVPKARKADVLLVEDNHADVYVTRLAFSRSKVGAVLHVVSDGDEAMDFLRRRGAWAGAPKPDLVLLDLNLPRKNGREVLSEMRADPNLRRIPVVVLTSSQADKDLVDVYDLGANVCFTKPSDPAVLNEIVVAIEDLWFVLGQLSPR